MFKCHSQDSSFDRPENWRMQLQTQSKLHPLFFSSVVNTLFCHALLFYFKTSLIDSKIMLKQVNWLVYNSIL